MAVEKSVNPIYVQGFHDEPRERSTGSLFRVVNALGENVIEGKRMLLYIAGAILVMCVCMFCMAFGAYELIRETKVASDGAMINIYGHGEPVSTGMYHERSQEPISSRDDDSLFRSLEEYSFDLVPGEAIRVTLKTSGFMRVPCAGCTDTDSLVHIFTDQGVLVVGEEETFFESFEGSATRKAEENLAAAQDARLGIDSKAEMDELNRLEAEANAEDDQGRQLFDATSKMTDMYCDREKSWALRTTSAFTKRIKCSSCTNQREYERRYCCQKAWCTSTAAPSPPPATPSSPSASVPAPVTVTPTPPETSTNCKCRWIYPPYRPRVRKCYGSGC